MLSSWQAQTAIGIPLFVAAIVVSLFAWREMHMPSRRNIAQSGNRAGSAGSIQKQATGASAADASDSHIEVRDQDPSQGARADIASDPILPSPASEAGSVSDTARALPPKRAHRPARPGVAKGAASKSIVSKNSANAGTVSSASKAPGKPSTDATQLAVTPVVAAVADSDVQIQIENRFSDAMLKIWIDDKLAYWHPLHDRKKHLLLLGGGSKETLTLPVSAGTHAVRIEVRSAAEQYDETKTVDGEFLTGGERSLSISFDKHSKEMRVALASQ
jgi:hypothetical protein